MNASGVSNPVNGLYRQTKDTRAYRVYWMGSLSAPLHRHTFGKVSLIAGGLGQLS